MATSDSTSSDEEYQSADEGDVRTGIEHLKVSDVTHQHVKEPVKETEEQCSHPTEPHVDNNVSESVVSHSPEGSREAGSCGKEEEGEFVAGLDNKYVCEGATISPEGKVELTEEQIKEMREQATKTKTLGNEVFKSGDYHRAIELYTEAVAGYPPDSGQELAVCYANRAACHMKLESHEDVVSDCTKALELKCDYLKALLRRAQSYEALDKLEDALADYKRVLELDPSQQSARQAVMRLPEQIKEQQEKLKAEMLGKLKELGNAVLKPFGLSTDNFQFQQDPNTGGYSVNFKN